MDLDTEQCREGKGRDGLDWILSYAERGRKGWIGLYTAFDMFCGYYTMDTIL